MRHFTLQSVRRRQPSTTTNSRSTNQPNVPTTLSFTTPGGSSSMKSFFGPVLAGSPMLHAQIKKTFTEAQAPYFSNILRAHRFSRSSSQHTLRFISLQLQTQQNMSRTLHFYMTDSRNLSSLTGESRTNVGDIAVSFAGAQ